MSFKENASNQEMRIQKEHPHLLTAHQKQNNVRVQLSRDIGVFVEKKIQTNKRIFPAQICILDICTDNNEQLSSSGN